MRADKKDWEDDQGTFCSWMLKYTDESHRRNALRLANNQMGLSFAAIHTTSMALSQVLFDLASKPQYIPALRQEIENVISQVGQELDEEGRTKLKKLNSFLKESQRLSPPEIIAMTRVINSPLTLSTGHTLPTGTRFALPSFSIHTSTTTPTFSPMYNPASYTSPLEFDGLRFFKLRLMPSKSNAHQYVTTSPDSLVFGHGSHACPGRFFASNEIKVMLVELLRQWEMRLKGDVEGKEGERPQSIMHVSACIPNMEADLEFRRLDVRS